MGNVPTPEALSLRWADVINDPALKDLPYKIELNIYGKIEMSPANNRHARLQGYIADIGVKVPDVAWATDAFLYQHGDVTPYPRAPELCVGIVSPSNSDEEMQEKMRTYLAAGAREVWLITEAGCIRYYDVDGERSVSNFLVQLSLPARATKS